MKSRVISFEGIPGVGKSTLVRNFNNNMRQKGVNSICIRELDLIEQEKTKFFEEMMELFSFSEDRYFRQIDPYIDTYLSQAVRYLICRDVLMKNKPRYDYILEDRGVDTYLSYALAGIKLIHGKCFEETFSYLWKMNETILEVADVTIRLKDTVEACVERSIKRGESSVHQKDIRFISEVDKAYDFLVEKFPKRIIQIDVDGQSKEGLMLTCIKELRKRQIEW